MSSKLSANRSILRNAGFLYVGKMLSQALRMVYLVALAKVLGPELFGTLTYAHFWMLLLLPLATFGTSRLLVQRVGAARDDPQRHLEENLALRMLTLSGAALLSLVLSVLLQNDELTRVLLLLYSATLAVRGLCVWTEHAFVALQSSERVFQMDVMFRSAEVIVGLCALAMGAGIVAVALIHLLSWVGQALFGWVKLRALVGVIRPRWDDRALRRLALAGAAFMTTALGSAVIERGGMIVLEALAGGTASLGQLALVLQALSVLLMAPKAVVLAALPVLSGQVADGRRDEKRTTMLLIRATIVGAAAVALAVDLLAPLVLPWLLGEGYEVAIGWMAIAGWLLVPLGVSAVLNQLVTAHGRFWSAASSALAGAVAMLAVLLFAAHLAAVPRVVLSVSVGAGAWALLDGWRAWRAGWLDLLDVFLRPTIAVLVSVVLYRLLYGQSPWLAWCLATVALLPGLASIAVLFGIARRLIGR